MTAREVHNQTDLDAALADPKVTEFRIMAGVDLTITATGSKLVYVGGSATIQYVGGSATIQYVGGSATIKDVGGSATIKYVGGSATIQDVGGSATIQYVGGSATIKDVGGSATIKYVGGSATIQDVRGSATIQDVRGSATIVIARGTAVVQALYDRSSVGASSQFVCVYVRSAEATVEGDAHVIDMSAVDESDPVTWCEMHGVEVLGKRAKRAVVYKAVDAALRSGHGTTYTVGGKVEAADWQPTNACGGGLHFGPTVRDARSYASGATRFLACEIRLAEAVGITTEAVA